MPLKLQPKRYPPNLSDLPGKLGNLVDEIVILGLVASFGIDMGETDIMPKRDGLARRRVPGMNPIIEGILFSLMVEVDVLVRSKGIRPMFLLKHPPAGVVVKGDECFFHLI